MCSASRKSATVPMSFSAPLTRFIVDPTPGVTRDRLTYLLCHQDRYFALVDTLLLLLRRLEPALLGPPPLAAKFT